MVEGRSWRASAWVAVVTGVCLSGGVLAGRRASGGALAATGAPVEGTAAAGRTFQTVVAPLLKARCVRCHGGAHPKADLRLDRIDGDLAGGKDGALWKEIYDRVSRGEMPPEGEPRLSEEDARKIASFVLDETRRAQRAATGSGGRTVMRRLNRTEYANTLRDLLHVTFPFGDGPMDVLPPDGSVDGFTKFGSALTLDPSLMDQFMTVARRVADTAIVAGPRPFESSKRRFNYADTARSAAIGYECREPHFECRDHDLVMMYGWARTWNHLHLDPVRDATIPANGVYTIRLRMGASLGARGEPLKVQLLWPGETVMAEWTLTARDAEPHVFEITLPIKVAGKNVEGPQVHLVNGTNFQVMVDVAGELRRKADRAQAAGDLAAAGRLRAEAEAQAAAPTVRPDPKVLAERPKLPKLFLEWIEIEGPQLPEWPPASHREIFFEGASAKPDLAYARRIFERLLPRAYRHPVAPAEVAAVVRRVEAELKAGESFEEAVRVGLEYVLTAPQFLYLAEPAAGAPRAVTDYELGSRLAYFLWSSLPDETLFQRAAEGRLRSPEVLASEVRRLLHDPKARALVDGFGAEWLQAGKFVGIRPNRFIYKQWDDELEAAAKREPLAFFEEILRNDLSALNFLDSDFAMLNGRLARHYGIPGVEGPELRRVKLPDGSHRGGLITQAGVLTVGSDGTRTLPVRRASWILTTLYNSPPNPPPPNVTEVEADTHGASASVRARLLRHQALPACAGCHRSIDPYGLGLENYDAVGAWRTRQNGEDFGPDNPHAPVIDASGTLPDGRAFRTAAELRAYLRADRDRFTRALTAKMFGYALGRRPEPTDGAALDGIQRAFAQSGYRLSALIGAIAASQPFQTK